MRVVPAPSLLSVPPGYRFRFNVEGPAAPAFLDDPDQIVFVFAREPEDLSYPLTVAFSARDDVALIGTDGRAGSQIALANGIQAIYHDGMWELASDDQLLWNDRDAHSLTVKRAAGWGTVAVRGARSRAASFGHLLRLLDGVTG